MKQEHADALTADLSVNHELWRQKSDRLIRKTTNGNSSVEVTINKSGRVDVELSVAAELPQTIPGSRNYLAA